MRLTWPSSLALAAISSTVVPQPELSAPAAAVVAAPEAAGAAALVAGAAAGVEVSVLSSEPPHAATAIAITNTAALVLNAFRICFSSS